MKVELRSDYEVTDAQCKERTGKTIKEWFKVLEGQPELEGKRRDTTRWLSEQMNSDTWWPTTIWVEYQKKKGVTLKDGKPDGYNICSTKSIAAPLSTVFSAFSDSSLGAWVGDNAVADPAGNFSDKVGNSAQVVRIREGKDIRYKWQTAGSPEAPEIEVLFAENAGKVGITLNHNRIQSRAEADGLRAAWSSALAALKKTLENK